MTSQPVLPGHRRDAQGRLVPVELIPEIDQLRDDLVQDIVAQAAVQHGQLAELKSRLFRDIDAFVDLSAERFDHRWGGEKGNITLTSYDGRYKVVRSVDEYVIFDERLQIAKRLVDECLHTWAEGAGPELRTAVSYAFQVDKKGRINIRRILEMRRWKIDHPTWQKAMQAITESLTVAGSRAYLRIYRRAQGARWEQILLDFSSIGL